MRARMVALVSVSALALAGCGGDDEPEETSSSTVSPRVPSSSGSSSAASSSSSSGSASSSGVSAEPPAEAQENTQAGAEAFAEWYWEQAGEATTTGSSEVVRSASSSTCAVCDELADDIDENAQESGTTRENPYQVTLGSSQSEGGNWLVGVDVSYDEYVYLDESGEQTGTVEAAEYSPAVEVSWTGESWVVENWSIRS